MSGKDGIMIVVLAFFIIVILGFGWALVTAENEDFVNAHSDW